MGQKLFINLITWEQFFLISIFFCYCKNCYCTWPKILLLPYMAMYFVFSASVITKTQWYWWSKYSAANFPLRGSHQWQMLIQKCVLWLSQQYHIARFPLFCFFLELSCSSNQLSYLTCKDFNFMWNKTSNSTNLTAVF